MISIIFRLTILIITDDEISSPSVQYIQTFPEITDRLEILFHIGEHAIYPDVIISSQPVAMGPPYFYLTQFFLKIDLLHLIRPPGFPVCELVSMVEHPQLEKHTVLCKLELLVTQLHSVNTNPCIVTFPVPKRSFLSPMISVFKAPFHPFNEFFT